MTTSGASSFNPARDQIIKRALRLVNAYASTGDPQPDQMEDALHTLNVMLKAWQVEGFLWLKQFATLFLVPGQAKYLLPGAKCAVEYAETTIATSTTTYPAISISVKSTDGMTAGDNIGACLDVNNLFWTTIISVDGPTTLTLATGLPTSATVGRPVLAYKNSIDRPTRISLPTRRVYGGSDLPMGDTGKTISREAYASLPNKTQSGVPLMAFYDPQLSIGALYLWPCPSDCRDRIVFSCDRPINDMLADANTFDVPQEQIMRIEYGLALALAPEYAMPAGDYDRLNIRYKEIAESLSSYDREVADTQIMMARR